MNHELNIEKNLEKKRGMKKYQRVLFHGVSQLKFSEEKRIIIDKILSYFKDFPDKVEFVKDHGRLPNCLSIPTIQFEDLVQDSQHFFFFARVFHPVDGKQVPTIDVLQIINNFNGSAVVYTDNVSIYNEILKMMKNREKIYVSIAFPENIYDYRSMFDIFYRLEDKNEEYNEAVIFSKKFPKWYQENTLFPKEIIKLSWEKRKLKDQEENELRKMKRYIRSYINIALNQEREDLFYYLSDIYRLIKKQLNEHKERNQNITVKNFE